MPSRWLQTLAALAVASAVAAQTQRSPDRPWALAEVAHAECRGGVFFGASISADSTRMLTIGEGGVAIEWDLVHARESKRFDALVGAFAVHMHPRDPWAIVLAGREPTHAHRLDFGTGRFTELWSEPVGVVAFDATGTRVALAFADAKRGSRLAVYPEAAVRATPPLPPDFEHDFTGQTLNHVFFHPRTGDVYADCRGGVLRVLPGGTATPTTHNLCGFLADGTEIVETRGRTRPVVAGEHWLTCSDDRMERGGTKPCVFLHAADPPLLPHPCVDSALAADGTVVAPHETGLLHLLGPEPDRRRTVRGQPGSALQLCFDASGRYLAIVGGCVTTVLDVENGTSARFDGTFALQASSIAGEFVVLEASSLSTMRGSDGRRTAIATLPATATARSFERYWTNGPGLLQFLWQPKAEQLWLAQVDDGIKDPSPARFHDGTLTAIALPHAPNESPFQVGLAIGTGRDGDVVLATTTRPMTCGNGLEQVRFWSSLSTYDRDGKQRCAQPLAHNLRWMRTSPAGALVAVPAEWIGADGKESAGRVAIFSTQDLKPVHELALGPDPIVAWQFVDEDTALASTGKTLLLVPFAAGTAKEIPVALPGPLTLLAVSADRALVAVACGSDVRVLRRR